MYIRNASEIYVTLKQFPYQCISQSTFRLATGQQHFLGKHWSTGRIDGRSIDTTRTARGVAGVAFQGAGLRPCRAGLARTDQRPWNARFLLRNGAGLPVRRIGTVGTRRWRCTSRCSCMKIWDMTWDMIRFVMHCLCYAQHLRCDCETPADRRLAERCSGEGCCIGETATGIFLALAVGWTRTHTNKAFCTKIQTQTITNALQKAKQRK